MKQVVSVLSLLLCSVAAFGQQSTASSDPATQEQVNRIFQLLNIDSQMAAMSGAMKQQSLAMVTCDGGRGHAGIHASIAGPDERA
jgi:hypothetical protein